MDTAPKPTTPTTAPTCPPRCPAVVRWAHLIIAAATAVASYCAAYPATWGPTLSNRLAAIAHAIAVLATLYLSIVLGKGCSQPGNRFVGLNLSTPALGTLKLGVASDQLPPYAYPAPSATTTQPH